MICNRFYLGHFYTSIGFLSSIIITFLNFTLFPQFPFIYIIFWGIYIFILIIILATKTYFFDCLTLSVTNLNVQTVDEIIHTSNTIKIITKKTSFDQNTIFIEKVIDLDIDQDKNKDTDTEFKKKKVKFNNIVSIMIIEPRIKIKDEQPENNTIVNEININILNIDNNDNNNENDNYNDNNYNNDTIIMMEEQNTLNFIKNKQRINNLI